MRLHSRTKEERLAGISKEGWKQMKKWRNEGVPYMRIAKRFGLFYDDLREFLGPSKANQSFDSRKYQCAGCKIGFVSKKFRTTDRVYHSDACRRKYQRFNEHRSGFLSQQEAYWDKAAFGVK